MKTYRLTRKVRTRLKHPIGQLVAGDPEKTIPILKHVIEEETPPKILVVGDFLTHLLLDHQIPADLYIIDNKVMRKPIDHPIPSEHPILKVSNPPGTITSQSQETIKRLTYLTPQIIVVDGEEDLLTLPLIKYAPIGSLVIYGQPHVGLVIVRVSQKMKEEIRTLLKNMVVDENPLA